MPTIESLTQKCEAVTADTPAGVLLARFQSEPDTLAIPVVHDGTPVGLVERDAFLLKLAGPLGRPLFGDRPVACVMDPETAVIEAGVRIDAMSDMVLKHGPGALMRAFIVTRHGRYQGVGTAVGLIRSLHEHHELQGAASAGAAGQAAPDATPGAGAAREISRFLSAVSHELRTPLNGVLAVSDLLQRQPLNPAAQSQVQTISESATALMGVLQNALDLARADAGELKLTPAPTRLQALMDGIQTDWSARALQDGVTLLMGYEGDTELAARIDADRARQVFNTLIGHALKYAREGVVEASLRAWTEGDQVRIEGRVRDDGPGVDAGRMAQLFEPFVEDGPGGGLSLAVCHRLVHGMGGRLWAENNAGRGATFASTCRPRGPFWRPTRPPTSRICRTWPCRRAPMC